MSAPSTPPATTFNTENNCGPQRLPEKQPMQPSERTDGTHLTPRNLCSEFNAAATPLLGPQQNSEEEQVSPLVLPN
jgi:hypothetical protein